MLLLDTDHLTVIQRKEEPAVQNFFSRMSRFEETELSVSIVPIHEQFLGWHAAINTLRKNEVAALIRHYRKMADLISSCHHLEIIPFDEAAGQTFQQLLAQGIRIGLMDLRIAAIAVSRDMTLLTRNPKDFGCIPGLRVEDWTTTLPTA